MRTCTWIAVVLAAGTLAASACTKKPEVDDDDTGGGGAGAHTTTSTPPTTSTPSTSSTTSTTTVVEDVCGSGMSYQVPAIDTCLTTFCCDSFNPCAADLSCQTCLTGSGSGCDTNALYQAFLGCFDGNCPADVCGSGIQFSDQNTGDPAFDCNGCAGESCCADVTSCVGDGSDAAIQLCLACLNGDASCTDQTIQGYAEAFMSCVGSSCASECGG